MPGQRWLRFASTWFDERTVDLVIEPLIADWRHEQSAAAGWRAVIVNVRCQLAILSSTLACLFAHASKPLPAGLGAGAWLSIAGFAGLGALILLALPFGATASTPPRSLGTLLPATLCLSLPLAAVPMLILVAARPTTQGRAARWLAFRVAIVLTAIMLPLAGWVTPAFNQNWRELHARADSPRPVLRGGRELTLSELFTPGASPMVTEPQRKREVRNRLAVILMPISLCALGIAASGRVRRPFRGALAWWVFATACWFLAVPLADGVFRRTAIFTLVPWAPNLMVLMFAGFLRRPRTEASVRG